MDFFSQIGVGESRKIADIRAVFHLDLSPLMERAIVICEASLVEGHPNRETARANLAAMLVARGEAEGE